ncbi:phage portal protein family protein [Micromonospora globbae]|uniref:phage portal protein family protein n=1 Tax=Micromonospora globbae TaxID=1894969 RepID=UPI0034334216
MAVATPLPVTEIGYAHQSIAGWSEFDADEANPELRWPQSLKVFDAMRTQDSQVASVLRAVVQPVLLTPWRIDPAGARDEVVEWVADSLSLPIVGADPTPPSRTRDRFSWPSHVRHALLMLVYGHMYFEQVYRIDDDGRRARLRKLAPRMPRTIEKIDVADDGGLIAIKQWGTMTGRQPQPIPVNRLVAYVHEQEAGNWVGRSLLRVAYKNWLLKDRLLRVDAETIERNGMGVPRYTGAPGEEDLTAGRKLAQGWRSGRNAGGAIPNGAKLDLVGVEGDLPQALPSIRYHDEQMARAVLAHFLNLGTQTGSWALGSTFADFFTLSLQALGDFVADVATAHVVEDLVDVNWGEDEPAPRVVHDEIGSRQTAVAAALKLLVDAGILTPDPRLEEAVRQQHGLPPADPATDPADDGQPTPPAAPPARAARARARRLPAPLQPAIPGLDT